MGQSKAKVAAILNARPEEVYATIADYRKGQADILQRKVCLMCASSREAAVWGLFSVSTLVN